MLTSKAHKVTNMLTSGIRKRLYIACKATEDRYTHDVLSVLKDFDKDDGGDRLYKALRSAERPYRVIMPVILLIKKIVA